MKENFLKPVYSSFIEYGLDENFVNSLNPFGSSTKDYKTAKEFIDIFQGETSLFKAFKFSKVEEHGWPGCFNKESYYETLKELEKNGVEVPKDIRKIGCYDHYTLSYKGEKNKVPFLNKVKQPNQVTLKD